ncbi:hypothetical protein STCU_05292 [Strigomonas culicis]|uniref:Uncharacterized protein n=1 Tax=Strigomonas culicis TaxID=28005 RepID=S9UGT0_9TRYP|nr:hypothetical protein STCU_05292 [Strigomonas culicis]|eukprot:EPY28118.1 hypothetical protein STCU_05292 [Strigomonas culicis]
MSGPVKDRYPPLSTDLADPRRRLAILIDGSALPLFPSAPAAAGTALDAAADGSAASLEKLLLDSALYNTLLPAVAQVGVPVLIRLFYFQMLNEWAPFFTHPQQSPSMGAAAASATDTERGGRRSIETRQLSTNVAATALQLPATAPPDGASTSSTNDNHMIQLEFFRVERFIPIPMQIEADAQHIYNYRHYNKIEGVCYVCHEVDRAIYERLMEKNVQPHPSSQKSFFNQFLFDELGLAREMANDGRQGDGSTMSPSHRQIQ